MIEVDRVYGFAREERNDFDKLNYIQKDRILNRIITKMKAKPK